MERALLSWLLTSLLIVNSVFAADPPPRIFDEGVYKGVYFSLDCVGSAITCSDSAAVATINISAIPASSFTASDTEVLWDNAGAIDGISTHTTDGTNEVFSGSSFRLNTNSKLNFGTTPAWDVYSDNSSLFATPLVNTSTQTFRPSSRVNQTFTNTAVGNLVGYQLSVTQAANPLTSGGLGQGLASVFNPILTWSTTASEPASGVVVKGLNFNSIISSNINYTSSLSKFALVNTSASFSNAGAATVPLFSEYDAAGFPGSTGGFTIPKWYQFRAEGGNISPGDVITDYFKYHAASVTGNLGTLTNQYGYYSEPMALGTNNAEFFAEGAGGYYMRNFTTKITSSSAGQMDFNVATTYQFNTANILLPTDGQTISIGDSGSRLSLTHNGTNAVLNPAVAGTGYLWVGDGSSAQSSVRLDQMTFGGQAPSANGAFINGGASLTSAARSSVFNATFAYTGSSNTARALQFTINYQGSGTSPVPSNFTFTNYDSGTDPLGSLSAQITGFLGQGAVTSTRTVTLTNPGTITIDGVRGTIGANANSHTNVTFVRASIRGLNPGAYTTTLTDTAWAGIFEGTTQITNDQKLYMGGTSTTYGTNYIMQDSGTGAMGLYGNGSLLMAFDSNGIGVFGTSPVAQQGSTGSTAGFSAGGGTTVTDDSTFDGGLGGAAYTIDDIVLALKNYGWLAP